MSERMNDNIDEAESKKGNGNIVKAGSVITAMAAGTFAVYNLLNPAPLNAGGDNNINGTSFSDNSGNKNTFYEKCGNYSKNKCVDVSPEFTFLGDQEIDIDFFDRNDIISNNGKITLIDNGHIVNIVDGAMAEKAVFGKEVKKIFKDDEGKLVIENTNGDKKYYTIEKVKNGITNIKEYFKVTISIDGGKTFIDSDELTKITKTLDLGGKEGKIIEIDNENGEVYKLYYNGKIIPLGFLNTDTKSIRLTNEGKLYINDKSINGNNGKTTIFQLSKNIKGEILAEEIKFMYK